MKWLATLRAWLRRVLFPQPAEQLDRSAAQRLPDLYCERVEDLPDELAASTLYLVGDGPHRWAAAMICPCGCTEAIQLNLLVRVRPSWTVQEHADGTVSLSPSVWRTKGCRSHFFVRRSRIEWCLDRAANLSSARPRSRQVNRTRRH